VDGLGVKACLDVEGLALDPDADLPDAATTEVEVRAYLRDRFPALGDADLRAARSCRYEITADTNFIAAAHPEQPGVWILGGGSGHGFKHGPAMAERVAAAISGDETLPARFGLSERTRSRSMRTAGSN
jgi:glycine/D-amino acid oxidase-like deaminating enzyme